LFLKQSLSKHAISIHPSPFIHPSPLSPHPPKPINTYTHIYMHTQLTTLRARTTELEAAVQAAHAAAAAEREAAQAARGEGERWKEEAGRRRAQVILGGQGIIYMWDFEFGVGGLWVGGWMDGRMDGFYHTYPFFWFVVLIDGKKKMDQTRWVG
jgi:hypothetical protein